MQGHVITTRKKLIILTAALASLLEIIDSSIVNVAVPSMMGNLGATLDEISWVITGYIIANAIVLPISSWMSHQIGRKFYYTACIILFTMASVACGLAPNLQTLVVFRIIQGFAGGALLPTSQSLIYESFPPEMAGMAAAIYGMSVMIGPTIGPTLGGFLTDNFGWRSIFNINLPIGIAVAMLSYVMVEDVGYDHEAAMAERERARLAGEAPKPKGRRRGLFKPKEERTPVDKWGLTFLVTGVGCLQYVLERGHAEDWGASKSIVIGSILAVSSLVALIWWELRTEHPILELRHFKNPTFRAGIMLMTGLGAMLYGLIFVLPVFISVTLGYTAQQIGELFIPGALIGAVFMPMIGGQLRKGRDPRQLIAIGIMGLAMAGVWIATFDANSSTSSMFLPLLLRGAAMPFLFVPINSTVLSQFQGPAIGQAAGLLNLCRQLGGSISIAVFSTLLAQAQVKAYTMLSYHVTPFDLQATQAFTAFSHLWNAKLATAVGMGTGLKDATQILMYRVKKQAFILAYQQTLTLVVAMFALALIPLRMLRAKKRPQPQGAPASAAAAPAAPEPVLDAH